MCGIYLQWNIIQPWKWEKFGYILPNGINLKFCAKWNKPKPRTQILYDST